MRTVLVKRHSQGSSSIASQMVSKKCAVAQCACRGLATCWAVPRVLVLS